MQVQLRTPAGADAAVDRLAPERVAEPVKVVGAVVGDHQPADHRLIDRRARVALVVDGLQQLQAELGAEHRGRDKRVAGRRRQSPEPVLDHGLDTLGQQRHVTGRAPGIELDRRAQLVERTHHLLDEERVARGVIVQSIDQRRIGDLLADHLSDRAVIQTTERQLRDRLVATDIGEHPCERMLVGDLPGPVAEHNPTGCANVSSSS